MTTKLKLYKGAARWLGQTRPTSLTEDVKLVRELDEVYDEVLQDCLESGWWNFAMRSAKIDATPSQETTFGVKYIYDKPDDWVRTYAVCSDEYFKTPDLSYRDENEDWISDNDPIYVKWVSNGVEYGLDLGSYPQRYTKFVQVSLAVETCEIITGSGSRLERLMELQRKFEHDAKNFDALNDPVTLFPPQGALVSSRHGSRFGGRSSSGEGRYRSG